VTFDGEDYAMLDSNLVLLFQTYRNSIGDIAAPQYSKWEELFASEDHLTSVKGMIMISVIWSVWVFHQFIMLILLLNFLIAIVS
jgi:hypothetical protein